MYFDELLKDIDKELAAAIQFFWKQRTTQQESAGQRNQTQDSGRNAVTGGGHMRALERLIAHTIRRLDLPDLEIILGNPNQEESTVINPKGSTKQSAAKLELPGYYRPEKKWDMLILSKERLVAALEIKGQVGPSFGNNSNNRTEEAIGVAEDFQAAFLEHPQRFRVSEKPFLGYIFLLEDHPNVHKPIQIRQPYFPVDKVFLANVEKTQNNQEKYWGVSYSKRYEILCRRLMEKNLYQATCLILTTNEDPSKITLPAEDLSFRRFIAKLLGHAVTYRY